MNHNFTQQDANTSHSSPEISNIEEEEGGTISCISEDLKELSLSEKGVFQQLNEVRYSPPEETLQRILKYGKTPLKELH